MTEAMQTDPADERVAAIQQLWSDGDYARIGEMFAPISERIVGELDDRIGLADVEALDAATGTGNTALALARAGANVRAFDLTPTLLAKARERASTAGLEVDFVEGDLLAIPFPDRTFELVVSTFGAFTADDHHRCMAELVRVTRLGGTVVSAAWADEGFFATLRTTVIERHPELLDPSLPDPQAWSQPDAINEMLEGLPAMAAVELRQQSFRFASTTAALELLEDVSGPVHRMRDGVIHQGGDWAQLRAEIIDRWDEEAMPVDGGVQLTGTYGVARIAVAG